MECDICKKQGPCFYCDGCNIRVCKSRGELSASEVKVLQLQSRVLIFHCRECDSDSTAEASHTASPNNNSDNVEINLLRELNEELQEKNQLLLKDIIALKDQGNNITYANAPKANSTNPQTKPASIILKPKYKDQDNLRLIQDELTKKTNVQVKAIFQRRDGNFTVKCNHEGDAKIVQDSLAKELGRQFTFTTQWLASTMT